MHPCTPLVAPLFLSNPYILIIHIFSYPKISRKIEQNLEFSDATKLMRKEILIEFKL